MRRWQAALLMLAGGLILVLALGCAAGWLIAARPDAAQHEVSLALGPRLRLDLRLDPCTADLPGRLSLWRVDPGVRNRFNNDYPYLENQRVRRLIVVQLAAACP